MKKCEHDWRLVFRDSHTNTNEWKCALCGETRQTQGDPKERPAK